MTLNKTNYNQIEEIVSLAEALGVDLIRFEIFIPLGNGKLNSNSLQLEDYQLEYIRDKSFNYRSDSVKIQYPIFNSKYGCGAGFISCIVNDDFTLSPCDMLASDVKTEPFRDIKHFEELWKCSKVFNKWRDLSVVDEYCEKCSHVDKCNYGCRAVSQAFEGNLNSADKLCMYREKD